jgi:hypothetical protein
MAIAVGSYIDDADINGIVSKINSELTRRGLSGAVSNVSLHIAADDSFFNTLSTRITSLKNSHCNCQAHTCPSHTPIVGRQGCSAHSFSPKTSPIEPLNTGDVPLIAGEAPGINTLPDIEDVDTDINYLQSIKVCHNCTCNEVCSCNNVQNCLSHCGCNKHCLCQTACLCNRVCCQSDCGCDNACNCEGDCGSDCSCASYSCPYDGGCGCDSFCLCEIA